MTLTTIETVLHSLGRIEGQLMVLVGEIATERKRNSVVFADHEQRIKATERHVWKVGGVLAAAAVAFEMVTRFIL